MKLIRCRNGFLDDKNGKCGHILAFVTDAQVTALKTDPEGGPVYRCRSCPADQRWVRLVDNGSGPVFEVIEKPDRLPDELEYADEKTYNQVG